jgi:tight adherence protein B
MSAFILFGLLFLLSFWVLFRFLKPSQMESALQRQLAVIEGGRASDSRGATILKETGGSSAPWLDDLMERIPATPALLLLIKQSGKTWRVSYLVSISLLMAILGWGVAWLMFDNAVLIVGIGAALGVSPCVYLYVLREYRFGRCDSQLPDAVDLMARALRAGHALSSVLEMVGQETPEPLGSEFRMIHEQQNFGLPMREAIMGLVERVPSDDMRLLVTAILVQGETGGNLALIFDKMTAVMRERARLRGQLKIYTAQGRITGWILCAMPFIMFGLLSVVDPGYTKILLTDPLGVHLIYAGLVMMVIGVLVIRKIIDIRV